MVPVCCADIAASAGPLTEPGPGRQPGRRGGSETATAPGLRLSLLSPGQERLPRNCCYLWPMGGTCVFRRRRLGLDLFLKECLGELANVVQVSRGTPHRVDLGICPSAAPQGFIGVSANPVLPDTIKRVPMGSCFSGPGSLHLSTTGISDGAGLCRGNLAHRRAVSTSWAIPTPAQLAPSTAVTNSGQPDVCPRGRGWTCTLESGFKPGLHHLPFPPKPPLRSVWTLKIAFPHLPHSQEHPVSFI